MRSLRIYSLTLGALNLAFNGVLAGAFLALGISAARSNAFPAPGFGLPWRSRRVTGFSARVAAAFMLFMAAVFLKGVWGSVQTLRLSLAP
jgi:hypothetical protein